MTAKNRTSSKHRKPGVYVDHSTLRQTSNVSFVKQQRAKKFAAIRTGGKSVALVPLVTPHSKIQEDESKEEADEGEEVEDEAAAEEAMVDDENEEDTASTIAGGTGLLSTATTMARGIDGFTVAFTPFRAVDSSTVTATAVSKLKDDKVLGVALWEWLLSKMEWDCHTLWERFLCDWDLITETERPPGTNRPINLHSYLSYLKSTNNKHIVRKDIREVRETLRKEREEAVREHPEDHLALPNLQALNGTLLQYYLKVKNLVPYESESQRKKKQYLEKKRKNESTSEEPEEKKEPAAADEIVEVEAKQPKKKKAKQSHPTPTVVAAAPTKSTPTATSTAASTSAGTASQTRRPRPPSSIVMNVGKASCFSALLDCD